MAHNTSTAELVTKQPQTSVPTIKKRPKASWDQKFVVLTGSFLAKSFKAQHCISCKWHSYSYSVTTSDVGGRLDLDRQKKKKPSKDHVIWFRGERPALSVATHPEAVLEAPPPCNPCGRSAGKTTRGLLVGDEGEELFFMADTPEQLEILVACLNFSDMSEPTCCARMLQFLFEQLQDKADGRVSLFSFLSTTRQTVEYRALLKAATTAARVHTAARLLTIPQVFGAVAHHIERLKAFESTLLFHSHSRLTSDYFQLLAELLSQAKDNPGIRGAWVQSGGLELFQVLLAAETGTNMLSTTVGRHCPLLKFNGDTSIRMAGFPNACQGTINGTYSLCPTDFDGRPAYVSSFSIGFLLQNAVGGCCGLCVSSASSLLNLEHNTYLFWNGRDSRWQISPERDHDAEVYAFCPENALLPDCIVSKWSYFHVTEEDKVKEYELKECAGGTCTASSDLLYHHLDAMYEHTKTACEIPGVATKVLQREASLVTFVQRFKLRGLGADEGATAERERRLLKPAIDLVGAALAKADLDATVRALTGPKHLGEEMCAAFLRLTEKAGAGLSLDELPTNGVPSGHLIEIVCGVIEGPIRIRHRNRSPGLTARLSRDVGPRLVDLAVALVEAPQADVRRFTNAERIMVRLRDLCELPAAANEACRDPLKVRRLFRQLERASTTAMDQLTMTAAATELSTAQSEAAAWVGELVDLFKVLCLHLQRDDAPHVRRAVYQCNLVPTLLKFIRYQANDDLLRVAAYALNLLADASLEHCETIEREGGVRDLLGLFRTGSPGAQHNACFALTALLRSVTGNEHGAVLTPSRHVAFLNEGGALTLVRFLRAATPETDPQYVQGLQVLAQRLVAIPTMVQPLVDAGLLGYLKGVFKAGTGPADGPAVSRCLSILEGIALAKDVPAALLHGRDIRGAVAASGVIDLLGRITYPEMAPPKALSIATDGTEIFQTSGISSDRISLNEHKSNVVRSFELLVQLDRDAGALHGAKGGEKRDVMISYCHKQAGIAHRLAALLRSQNISVWIDTELGADIFKGMVKAVLNAGCVLSLLSPDYAESANCKRELHFAEARGKKIIPVLAAPDFSLKSNVELQFIFMSGRLFYYKLGDVFRPEFPEAPEFTDAVNDMIFREGIRDSQPAKAKRVEVMPPSGARDDSGAAPPPYGFDGPPADEAAAAAAGEDLSGFGGEDYLDVTAGQ